MMLSETELQHYNDKGWVVPDYRVPAALLAEAQRRADAMFAARPDYADLYPDLLDADIWFLEIAREPGLLDMLAQVLGPEIVLWTGAIFGKPAGAGKATPWHQDGEYWPIRPLATATVWVALDASTPENGCLRVIDGSHRDARLYPHRTRAAADVTLHQELDPAFLDESRVSGIVLEPGQVSIHDVYLVHGSEPNRSASRRAGITYRYMPGGAHFDRALSAEQHREKGVTDLSQRDLYLLRGEATKCPNAGNLTPLPGRG